MVERLQYSIVYNLLYEIWFPLRSREITHFRSHFTSIGDKMKKYTKNTQSRIPREQLNAAMEEYFSRGGRIKKVKIFEIEKSQNNYHEFEDEIYDDYSPIEFSNSMPLRRSRRNSDFE